MPICRTSSRTRTTMLCATAIYERLVEFLAQRQIPIESFLVVRCTNPRMTKDAVSSFGLI
ncbi:hypothetical protein LINPERPRIM_LOCUS1157 [Linum perenne]